MIVRSSSEYSQSQSQVSNGKKVAVTTDRILNRLNVQRQRSMSWPQHGKYWSDHSDAWSSNSSQNCGWMDRREKHGVKKERNVSTFGGHTKTGASQAVVARGRTGSMKDATRRLWAPSKSVIERSSMTFATRRLLGLPAGGWYDGTSADERV